MKRKALPSREAISKVVRYDADNGELYWLPREGNKEFNSRFAGQPCRTRGGDGYLRLYIDGKLYLGHRLIWKLLYDSDPDEIDHVNGDRTDNRAANLRNVSHLDNMKNQRRHSTNKSGCLGVNWSAQGKRWIATIGQAGPNRYIGCFETYEEAVAARRKAEEERGYHVNHGT